MIPAEVIREMRLRIEDECPPGIEDVKNWADALEAAMREPVAEIEPINRLDGSIVTYCRYDQYKLPPGTKLYTFPPDAAAEIERLHSDLETAERALDAQTDFRKEIERLNTALREIQCACITPRPGVVDAVREIACAALAKEEDK
jgi:hypothetical protein